VPAVSMTLRTALGRYPHTQALHSGEVGSDWLKLEFAEVPTINRAFAPMVREQRFDVCEMAIATFLQARAYGKPLTLLPVVLAARFQESALLRHAGSNIAGPADLIGKRVGVRAYSQTTGMWLRGILQDSHSVNPDRVRWVTFEDAHVAEYRDPPWAERAAAGSDMLGMLRAGDLDAVVVGNEIPGDPAFRTVFPDPAEAARAFWGAHRFVPVNHLVCVRTAMAEPHPEAIAELMRMFDASRDAARPDTETRRALPIGREALGPAVALALRYCTAQGLLPQRLTPDEIWQGFNLQSA
jgi:4,5-dihydroxyphthalate decarboxylase